ncbi:MAG: transglutaminase domain-containing protein [Anaerolineales bacterium]
MKKSLTTPRWWDWISIALLFLLLQTLASRLVNTSWTPFLYLTQVFAAEAVIIGLILGYSHFSRGVTRFLSFFYMLILLPLQWTLIINQEVSLEEQLSSVWGRLFFSVSELIAKRPVEDPIFFVAVMSLAFWIVCASAGFALTRNQNYLRVVLPAAIGIVVIQHYDNVVASRIWGLGLFAFLALVLLGRLHYLQNKDSWRARRVFISAENSLDLAGGMAILAGLIIFVAFMVPASRFSVDSARKAWNRLTQPWHNITEKMENAVSAVDAPSSSSPGEFYGTELQLGRGFPLSDAVMFEVRVPDLSTEEKPPRYYWRGRTYDFYGGGQWYITGTTRADFSPRGNGPIVPNTEERNPQKFSFKVGDFRFSLLYGPSEPVWYSRPGSYLGAPADVERADKDIVTWNAAPSLLPGETYEVQSVVKNPNVAQLRESGMDYPDWVKDKYLQLPQSFSPRLAQLAKDITANSDNPYDKATEITHYLRTEIEYAPTVPLPPRNRDALEWVVFDYKKAYCVYYASAEVLMLRSLGIPARMAVGFAQGTPTEVKNEISGVNMVISNSFTVQKKNAHAWPEVYFPGIGWTEFEPTASQAALSRPLPPVNPADGAVAPNFPLRSEDNNDFAGRDALDEEGVVQDEQQTNPINPSLYLIPSFIALAALVYFLGRRYNLQAQVPVFVRATFERSGLRVPTWVTRWEYWSSISPIAKAFESINFGLRLLKQPAPISSTPVERANALSQILPHLNDPIKVLLDEHQTSLYTFRIANVNEARRSALTIRMQTIVAVIRHFFNGEYAVRS